MKRVINLLPSVLIWISGVMSATAGFYEAPVSPGNVPWPGGVVPYVFDNALSTDQKQAYIDGLREYELAANVHFIPRTTESQYVLFKYAVGGPNRVSGSNPQLVEINLLTRGQICHEMGHSLGLAHEHQRPDRNARVNVLYSNVIPGNSAVFDIDANGHLFGSYDFESVMHYGRDILSIQQGLDTLQVKPGFEKYQKRMSNFALSPGDRALMSFLYGPPPVALTAIVTTTADGGTGSLRAAMYYATDHPGTTVTFNIPQCDPGFANGVFTIKPTGYLPPLVTNGTVVDASTQPGYAGKPLVFLNGSKLIAEAGSVPGLLFYETNCTVKGLGIQQFPWVGMALLHPEATGNRVSGCWCGLDRTGNSPSPNATQGILISDGASGNTIGGTSATDRNVLSGNTEYGIWISDPDTTGNTVLGNYIGTNADGTAALANIKGGVIITDASHHNTIGGAAPGARNVISGNTDAGIWLTGTGVSNNRVEGNHIGLNAAGTAAIPNTFVGAYVINGASYNAIVGNVISGNAAEGLRLAGTGTSGNTVLGNRVGTTPDGNGAIANGFAGVPLFGGATGNRIGGTLVNQGNILSGNGTVGLAFGDTGTSNNLAYGNRIGTNPAGTSAVPNGFAGVFMTGGSSANHLGDGPGTGNLISANNGVGVFIADAATSGNFVRNNTIGPGAMGGTPFTNQFDGISISGGAQATKIGGSGAGHANIISGNTGRGIALFTTSTAGHTFQRNSIDGNGYEGIGVYDNANHSQTSPVLTSATLATSTNLSGTLVSTANTTFTIEFFSSSLANPPGGRNYIGQLTVATNGSGNAGISVSLPAIVAAGRRISATATSQATGDTSGFSNKVTVVSTDGDNDGLPNAYENSTPGLNSANPADANLDFDGDGFTNLQEFTAGTNPNDATSRPIATGAAAGPDFLISFGTVSGRIYRVERSETLVGVWSPVAIHVPGTGTAAQIAFPISGQHQFYRVTAEP